MRSDDALERSNFMLSMKRVLHVDDMNRTVTIAVQNQN